MKRMILISTGLALLILSGCAKPINKATPEYPAEDCQREEWAGRLGAAERACDRALIDVDLKNLGPDVKSLRLYNLGRIKRRIGKFAEAEDPLKKSLAIEEKLSGPQSQDVGRRLTELCYSLAGQNKWEEGVSFLEKLLPIADSFSGHERSFIAETFQKYSHHFLETGQTGKAQRYLKEATILNR